MLARMYRKGNPCILLVELYIKAAITENSMEPGYSGASGSLALGCVRLCSLFSHYYDENT